jgi:hypothetical protein
MGTDMTLTEIEDGLFEEYGIILDNYPDRKAAREGLEGRMAKIGPHAPEHKRQHFTPIVRKRWWKRLFSSNVPDIETTGKVEPDFEISPGCACVVSYWTETGPDYLMPLWGPVNSEVLGYSPKWVDEDYNPEGVRICFINDEGVWSSARWDNEQDRYETEPWDSMEIFDNRPTHVMPKPTTKGLQK